MPRRLLRFVDSVNPAQVGLSEADVAVRALRFGCTMTAFCVPLYGLLYRALGVAAVDPLWLRAAVGGAALAMLALSYVSAGVRRHALGLHQASMTLLLLYMSGWAVANGFTGDAAVGLLFSFAVLSMSHSLTYTQARPYGVHLAGSAAVVVGAAALVPTADVSRIVFVLCVVVLAAVQYVVVMGRFRFQAARAASERRLAEAERLAGVGSWDFDPTTGHRVWSDGLYRLTGLPPGTPPPRLTSLAHPDDREAATAARARILESGQDEDAVFRIVTAAGETRTVRMVLRTDRGRSGEALHVSGAAIDVTDHVDREAALRHARDRAEEGAQAKSAFLANMSHEIRTPLTAIIGFAQLLGEEAGPAHRDLVEPIESGGQRLLATLNSVLDLARMEAGEGDLVVTAVDAGAEARDVVRMLDGLAAAKGVGLRAEVVGRPAPARADRAALNRVLTNLASNAVKFTDAGHVVVRVRPGGPVGGGPGARQVVVEVEDTGRGMDAAFLTELYEPFRQASTGWARSHEGTGLGLTIARRLVEDMGGTLDVVSAPGRGTTFSVALPAVPEGEPAAGPADGQTADVVSGPARAAA